LKSDKNRGMAARLEIQVFCQGLFFSDANDWKTAKKVIGPIALVL